MQPADLTRQLSGLLSSLRTDAEMALDDRWDRSDDGFAAQVDQIEAFAARFQIPLYDTTTAAEEEEEETTTHPLQATSDALDAIDLHTLQRAWHDRFNQHWDELAYSTAWKDTELAQVHQLADWFDQVVQRASTQPVGNGYYLVKRDGVTAQQLLNTLQGLDIYLANEAEGIVITEAQAMPLVCGEMVKIVLSKLSVWGEAEQALLDQLTCPSTV